MRDMTSWLFETGALKVAPEKNPFFYTSGLIGPYYINTHFLYDGERNANELLALIDAMASGKAGITGDVLKAEEAVYRRNKIYRSLIDAMCAFIAENIGDRFDYISGGARRDWFFSVIIAAMLGKEHLTIFKDMEVYKNGSKLASGALNGAKTLHICDIITTASSYTRQWFPAIAACGGAITDSLAVLDRLQGGAGAIENGGARSYSMAKVDSELFIKALVSGYIDSGQFAVIDSYTRDPDKYVKDFIAENPAFLTAALSSADEKTVARARLLRDWLDKDSLPAM